MAITVETIEQKEFKTKMMGYDPIEVDEFLDEICDELIALQDEIANVKQQLMQARAQVARPQRPEVSTPVAPVPVATPQPRMGSQMMAKEQEETLRQLLVNAQKVSDDTVAEAHSRAEKIVDEAQTKADKVLASISTEKENLTREVEELQQAAKDYRDRFMRLVEDQKHVLHAEKELFGK